MTVLLPDAETGKIVLQFSNSVLGRHMQKSVLAQIPDAQGWTETVRTQDFAGYTLVGRYRLAGREVGVAVWFAHGVLTSVTIFPRSAAQDWSSWSEDDALQQRDDLDRILTASYGTQRQFDWGSITADYDPRSGSSSISIRYTSIARVVYD